MQEHVQALYDYRKNKGQFPQKGFANNQVL
jgi:hypothetical protein